MTSKTLTLSIQLIELEGVGQSLVFDPGEAAHVNEYGQHIDAAKSGSLRMGGQFYAVTTVAGMPVRGMGAKATAEAAVKELFRILIAGPGTGEKGADAELAVALWVAGTDLDSAMGRANTADPMTPGLPQSPAFAHELETALERAQRAERALAELEARDEVEQADRAGRDPLYPNRPPYPPNEPDPPRSDAARIADAQAAELSARAAVPWGSRLTADAEAARIAERESAERALTAEHAARQLRAGSELCHCGRPRDGHPYTGAMACAEFKPVPGPAAR